MDRFRIAIASLLLLASTACFADDDEDEEQQNLLKTNSMIEEGPAIDYVRAVGKRVAAQSAKPNLPYHFHLIDDYDINAFAKPNHGVYLHRGLLLYLKTEDQLAAVLGHEVGHIALGHVYDHSDETLLNIAAFAATLLTFNSDVGDAVRMYGQETVLGRGREQELEADAHGALAIAKAGYDPMGAFEAQQILKDQEVFSKQVTKQRVTYHAVFSTHPTADLRLQRLIADAQRSVPNEVAEPIGDYLSIINGMTFGNSSAQGIVQDHTYYHGRLGLVLEFPNGWAVRDSTTKILAYPPAGATGGFLSMETDVAGKSAPKDYVVNKLKPGTLSNEVEFTVGEDKEDQFPAYRATVALAEGTLGTSEIGALMKDGRVYIFRGETRDPKNVNLVREGLKYSMEHLRRMTITDLRRVDSVQRIAIYEAKPGDTYESLAKTSPIESHAVEQLRLLNGDYPSGQPRAGDRIKIVVASAPQPAPTNTNSAPSTPSPAP